MQHIIIASSAIILLVSLLNPFDLWMPGPLRLLTALFLVIVVGIFAGLVLHESPRDEREASLRDQSGRIGYLAGISILTLGIMVTVFLEDRPDVWVVTALGAMVTARVMARFFGH